VASAAALQIAVLLPDLLGTYGDRGNATVLAQRLRWRGHPAEIIQIASDTPIPSSSDVYLLGGGEDVAQVEATRLLDGSGFAVAAARGAVVLAVCAGLQILGESSVDIAGRRHSGLGLLDLTTRPLRRRAVGEILTMPTPDIGLGTEPLTGFENHRGATTLGPAAAPLARVRTGVGNGDGNEGVVCGQVFGTYLHGPVLARNPALADHLLSRATGLHLEALPVDDVDELRLSRLRAGHERHDSRARRLRSAFVPRRWVAPGVPSQNRRGD
jgi:hypothetical protein